MTAPKPPSRAERVSLWQYFRLFRRDILSAQPARLYRAKMAEFRTPFFRSFLINQPELVRQVLVDKAGAFPKSARVTAGLRPLLGNSVFVSGGGTWEQQRRLIDPAFSGGRVKAMFPQMVAAASEAANRVEDGPLPVEETMSRVTADVIFRTLFSRAIDDALATRTYNAFRTYQRSQPVLTAAAFLPGAPALVRPKARRAARDIREALATLIKQRRHALAAGKAPDDMVTKLMTASDPETGYSFSDQELLDQVAIFFLAGHETSAATLSWALWLLAAHPKDAALVRAEADQFGQRPEFQTLSQMPRMRDVIRETLRLYPPVPMMVREASSPTVFRGRKIRSGDQIVVSPWHIHRHEDYWRDPDEFRPGRWTENAASDCFLPFSSGPRICPGAGFAMTEAVIILAAFMNAAEFDLCGPPPVPVAHLTVRSQDGITLMARRRVPDSAAKHTA